MDCGGRILWAQPQVLTPDNIIMVLLLHFPLWVSAALLWDVCGSQSCPSFLGLAASILGSFPSLGETVESARRFMLALATFLLEAAAFQSP